MQTSPLLFSLSQAHSKTNGERNDKSNGERNDEITYQEYKLNWRCGPDFHRNNLKGILKQPNDTFDGILIQIFLSVWTSHMEQ